MMEATIRNILREASVDVQIYVCHKNNAPDLTYYYGADSVRACTKLIKDGHATGERGFRGAFRIKLTPKGAELKEDLFPTHSQIIG